jgi:hypothetical protein
MRGRNLAIVRPLESLGFTVQSPFSTLAGFFNKKSNLLKTRVIIYD